MMFYRMGELTDDHERQKWISVSEKGDELQKGLVCCAASILSGVIGIICAAIFLADLEGHTGQSFKIGGLFFFGVAVIVGLPAICWVFLYKTQAPEPQKGSLAQLAKDMSDEEVARMLPAVKELAKKISDSEKKNKESQSLTGLAVFSSEVAKRYKSFSEFGRSSTIEDFEKYREDLLKKYTQSPQIKINKARSDPNAPAIRVNPATSIEEGAGALSMVDLTEKDQTKITALTSPVKQQPASSVGSKRVRWEPASAKNDETPDVTEEARTNEEEEEMDNVPPIVPVEKAESHGSQEASCILLSGTGTFVSALDITIDTSYLDSTFATAPVSRQVSELN